jgi:hypothetical protein
MTERGQDGASLTQEYRVVAAADEGIGLDMAG